MVDREDSALVLERWHMSMGGEGSLRLHISARPLQEEMLP